MATDKFKPALVIVDMQNDFCPPSGTLAVEGARDLAPVMNTLLSLPFTTTVATQDWHPQNHVSFASNHPAPDNKPYVNFAILKNPRPGPGEPLEKPQRLWPDHCLQHSSGAEIIEEIDQGNVKLVVKKGMDPQMEMYSTFANAFGHFDCFPTGVDHDLVKTFKEQGITHVYSVGVAGDYCLKSTAIDAARAGFVSYVVEEGVKSVDPGEGWKETCAEFDKFGVKLIHLEGEEVARVKGAE